ncbi:MAG: hypothetical protein KID00_01075 [Clostridium argentinense]|nr:hypothetical protein [Clostridium argentinense]
MEFNDNEKIFFEMLHSKFNENKLNKQISYYRMSNKTISVNYASYPLGKIKLQGRVYRMLIIKNLYDNYSFEGNLDECISKIDEWVKYAKRYL